MAVLANSSSSSCTRGRTTAQPRHGWRWFHAVANLLYKFIVEQRTRMYAAQPRYGWRWFHAVASLPRKLVVEQLYTDVQLLNRATDGAGSTQ